METLIEKYPLSETYIYTGRSGNKLYFCELGKVKLNNQFCWTHYIGLTTIARY